MGEQDVSEVVNSWLAAINSGDPNSFAATLDPDAVYDELPTGRGIQGAEEFTNVIFGWREPFPDLKRIIKNLVVDGDTAVMEVEYQATHSGPVVGTVLLDQQGLEY